MDSASDAAVQPSLLKRVREPDPDWICPPGFYLGCDLLDSSEDEFDALLSQVDVSQIDSQLDLPSADHESSLLPVEQGLGDMEQFNVSYSTGLVVSDDSSADRGSVGVSGTRFGPTVTAAQVESAREAGVPPKMRGVTLWSCRVWSAWVIERKSKGFSDSLETQHELSSDFSQMSVSSMKFWLPRFVLEVRRADQKHYPPDSLYSICSGLQRALKFADRADVKLLSDPCFSLFRDTLDSEMKRLCSTGEYTKKKAGVIGVQEEALLWEKGFLGDTNLSVLLDTLVYLYFAIRGGEHRNLHFKPSQIVLYEPPNTTPYLLYTEFISKTNQGGLQHRKKCPKQVMHHANLKCPERCLVRLYKLYNSKCPEKRPNSAFYLRPLVKPREDVWYSCNPMGHNTLANTVPCILKEAGIAGYFTNHSLRATSETRLFDEGVDEQLIMARTGHCSSAGVRSYKRIPKQLCEKTSEIFNVESCNKTVPANPIENVSKLM